jgi:ferrous iron transport protein B
MSLSHCIHQTLNSKASIPMLVGFGCNVPAIMATRTLENNRDRVLTILMNPFMSCGARLPVYTLFTAAFFSKNGGTVLFSLYLIGILMAILSGILFKNTILSGAPATFVMELPPYHMPTLRGIMFHTWTRLKDFILRAGQVILVVVVILSFLNSFGTDGSFGNNNSEKSVLSAVSKKAGVVFSPMGLKKENWPAAVGLFTGVFAKEAIVGTLDTLYSHLDAEAALTAAATEKPFDFWQGIIGAFRAVPDGFREIAGFEEKTAADDNAKPSGQVMVRYFDGKVGAYAYLLFILLYAPCVATIAAIYREAGGRWAVFSVIYLTTLAWVVSTAFYQLGTFAAHPGSSAAWLLASAAVLATMIGGLKLSTGHLRVES